jgi:sugar/nucleoside kinase (ribokinase family)
LAQDYDLEKCIMMANAIGAIIVTKRGAITASPEKKELGLCSILIQS